MMSARNSGMGNLKKWRTMRAKSSQEKISRKGVNMSQAILLNIDLLLLSHKWVLTWRKFRNRAQKSQTERDQRQMAAGNQKVSAPPCAYRGCESVTMTFGSFVIAPHPNDLDDALLFYNLIHQPVLYVDSSGVSAAQITDQFFIRGRRLERIFAGNFQQLFSFRT